MASASEQEVRSQLERRLPADLPLVFEDQFSQLTGFRVHAAHELHLKSIAAAAPLLQRLLAEGERVHLISRARVDYGIETALIGAMAALMNHTLFVATDRRLLLIHASSKFEPYLYVNEVPRQAIKKVRSSIIGGMRFKLGKGNLTLGLLQGRDRKTLKRLYDADRSAQGGVRLLCPSCFHAHARHVRACSQCGVEFRSPKVAALRSLLLPGLGDWYLGHRHAALLEMLGAVVGFGVAAILTATAIAEQQPGLILVGVAILLFGNGVDALLTQWQAKKGLLAVDGFLPSRSRGTEADSRRGPAAQMQARVEAPETHPAERVAPPWLALFGLVVLMAVVFIGTSAQGILTAEYHGEWGPQGETFEGSFLSGLEDPASETAEATPAQRSAMSKCMAHRTVDFLNDTPCKAQYDSGRTTEEAFFQEQTTCLESVNFEETSLQIAATCMAEAGFEMMATGDEAEEPEAR